jgi:hypothetical protein
VNRLAEIRIGFIVSLFAAKLLATGVAMMRLGDPPPARQWNPSPTHTEWRIENRLIVPQDISLKKDGAK